MKKIKIPKLLEDGYTFVEILREGVLTNKGGLRVYTKKQTIAGVEIPSGMELFFWNETESSIHRPYSRFCKILMPNKKLNPILKSLVIRNL